MITFDVELEVIDEFSDVSLTFSATDARVPMEAFEPALRYLLVNHCHVGKVDVSFTQQWGKDEVTYAEVVPIWVTVIMQDLSEENWKEYVDMFKKAHRELMAQPEVVSGRILREGND